MTAAPGRQGGRHDPGAHRPSRIIPSRWWASYEMAGNSPSPITYINYEVPDAADRGGDRPGQQPADRHRPPRPGPPGRGAARRRSALQSDWASQVYPADRQRDHRPAARARLDMLIYLLLFMAVLIAAGGRAGPDGHDEHERAGAHARDRRDALDRRGERRRSSSWWWWKAC